MLFLADLSFCSRRVVNSHVNWNVKGSSVVSLVDTQPPLQLKRHQTGIHSKSTIQKRIEVGGTRDKPPSIQPQDGRVLIDPEKPWESLLDPRESVLLPIAVLKLH